MANDEWIHELTTHPFISSKIMLLTFLERPGKAIYLMKQRSKLMRGKRESKKHPVKISISEWGSDQREEIKDDEKPKQRRKTGKSSYEIVDPKQVDLDKTMV
jgi:hypothetical protein